MNKEQKYTGYIFSLVFHIIFAFIFLNINIDLKPKIPEFFEMTFTVVNAGNTRGETFNPPQPAAGKPSTKKADVIIKKKEVVNLPQRKAVIIEVPEITVTKKEKIFFDESPSRLGDRIEIRGKPERESTDDIISMLKERTEKFDINRFDVTEDAKNEINAEDAGMNVSAIRSYTIDWVGEPREKLRGNLPVYPQGMNKTTVIKLRFKVFSDGTVGEILPLQKGDTILENVAINSLKEWQFNALEENAPQVMQEGIIAFVYRLE